MMRRGFKWVIGLGAGALVIGLVALAQWLFWRSDSNDSIRQYLSNPTTNADLNSTALTRCGDAPFIIPSDGFIGLLWRDDAAPYTPLRRHTGIDIFGGRAEGTVAIYAAYDGWLTRLDDWQSTIIIRHDDPLQEGRTIWTYYTHMASRDGQRSFIVEDYPQGTYAVPITQGTLIGYQGAYSPGLPVAIHLHMSIVTSNPDGSFRNEALLENTLDPSPYFGIELDVDQADERPVRCRE
ncbi:MAG: M23 family metallopeptidase [Anaerolineae bacterium]